MQQPVYQFLSRWTSIDHPSVLFALCVVAFVLICLCLARLQREPPVIAEWHLPDPPMGPSHIPDWSQLAVKGFTKPRVVDLERRRLQMISKQGGRDVAS